MRMARHDAVTVNMFRVISSAALLVRASVPKYTGRGRDEYSSYPSPRPLEQWGLEEVLRAFRKVSKRNVELLLAIACDKW